MRDESVSVIIPTYNRAELIRASVESVLGQTHRDLEVIVVDDGSSDDTESVISSISDDRLIYHKLEKNGGVSNARNIGAGLAKNQVIAFHDSDDIWFPEKLEEQLSYWSSHPEDVMVYCAYKVDLPDGSIRRMPSENDELYTLEGDIFYYLLLRPSVGTPTMVMRKDIFEEAGGFDTSCRAFVDWDLSLRLAKLGSIGYVDKILMSAGTTSGDRISDLNSPEKILLRYDMRCRFLARYLDEINAIDKFDFYSGKILQQAKQDNVLEPVKKMMMEHLAEAMKN